MTTVGLERVGLAALAILFILLTVSAGFLAGLGLTGLACMASSFAGVAGFVTGMAFGTYRRKSILEAEVE
jgi:hypothetical protein